MIIHKFCSNGFRFFMYENNMGREIWSPSFISRRVMFENKAKWEGKRIEDYKFTEVDLMSERGEKLMLETEGGKKDEKKKDATKCWKMQRRMLLRD